VYAEVEVWPTAKVVDAPFTLKALGDIVVRELIPFARVRIVHVSRIVGVSDGAVVLRSGRQAT